MRLEMEWLLLTTSANAGEVSGLLQVGTDVGPSREFDTRITRNPCTDSMLSALRSDGP